MRMRVLAGFGIGAVIVVAAVAGYLQAARQPSVDIPYQKAVEQLRNVRARVRAEQRPPVIGEPIALLEIPRLGLAGVIVEGDTSAVLDRGIGHLPDTPLPWQVGNSAVAAHRTTLFKPLRNVREGDALILSTPRGDLRYRVRRMTIVDPQDLSVLDPTPRTTLTLITCYPFDYVGMAPQRFIVQAEQIDVDPALRDPASSG
jgi:sortase A